MGMGMTVLPRSPRLYDGHRGNSGDWDSSHGSTAVAGMAPMVNALFIHELK